MQPNQPIPVQQPQPPANDPLTMVSLPQQVVDQLTAQPVGKVAEEVKTVVSDVQKHYKSPAFWTHLAVQGLIWLGYAQTLDPGLKATAIIGSASSLIAYLFHLAISG